MTTPAVLHRALLDAGLRVRQYPGWETRGGSWKEGKPVGLMHHHTAAPVPFPVDRLAGPPLIKCNMNTKPDGTLWLVSYGACNYSSGSGSSKVLAEVLAGTPPTRNADDRDLWDDTNGNPFFWNSENDHYGTGGPLPAVQEETIVTATRVVNDHFGLSGRNMIGHACWTHRKQDPYWNGNRRAIDEIRNLLEEDMATAEEIVDALLSRNIEVDLPGGESRSLETIIRSLRYDSQRAHTHAKKAREQTTPTRLREATKLGIAAAGGLVAGASAEEIVAQIGRLLSGG